MVIASTLRPGGPIPGLRPAQAVMFKYLLEESLGIAITEACRILNSGRICGC